jgi:hypothetical protein
MQHRDQAVSGSAAILIGGGTVVTPPGSRTASVYIGDGRIIRRRAT